MNDHPIDFQRRKLLRYGCLGLGAMLTHSLFLFTPRPAHASNLAAVGPLQAPDANGVRLPQGFTSRIVARSGQNLFGYRWHAAPDGGATFTTDEGGWIYVSNSEMKNVEVGANSLRWNGHRAYSILTKPISIAQAAHALANLAVAKKSAWQCLGMRPLAKNRRM